MKFNAKYILITLIVIHVMRSIETIYDSQYVVPLQLIVKNKYANHFKRKDFTSIRGDGIGQQLQAIMYSIAFSSKSEWTYYYSPMVETPKHARLHEITGQTVAIDKWLNMGFGELSIDSCVACQVGVPDFARRLPIQQLFDGNTIKMLRKKYYQNKDSSSTFYKSGNNTFNVAVHVRRGDIDTINNGTVFKNLSPNSHYIKAMDDIYHMFNCCRSETNIEFHIFSDSKIALPADEYSRNGIYNIIWHINEDWKKSFHSLVVSDALIMSKSTYSWTAAILSASLYIYYTPFDGGQALKSWYLNCESNFTAFEYDSPQWTWWNNCSFNDNERRIYHHWSCGKPLPVKPF